MSGLAWLLLLGWLGGGDANPSFVLQGDRHLVLGLPAQYLEEPRVNKMLYSGLTTSFVFAMRAHAGTGGLVLGGARVDVRFEPWDEVFYLTLTVPSGIEKLEMASYPELLAWFAEYHVPVADLRGFDGQAWHLELVLKVLPFSESEQADTQKWFAETLNNESNKNDPNTVLDVLLATSIKRKSLISQSWDLEMFL